MLQGNPLRRLNGTVVLVLSIFGFLYNVNVFCVIVPWLSFSVPGVTNLGFLTVTTMLALQCYFSCLFFDPGRVPLDYMPDEESPGALQEVKKKGGAARFCQKCQQYKPPRSHHCRVCKRCVLRMDHHCPWVNNCIGSSNYKPFFLLLVYATAALLHSLGLLLAHAAHVLTSSSNSVLRAGPRSEPILLHRGLQQAWVWALIHTVAIAVALPVSIGVTLLLGWHVNMLLSNRTTIEYQEGVTARVRAAREGTGASGLQHPYNLGLCNNMHEVLGQNASAWLLPPQAPAPISAGLSFPTVWDLAALNEKEPFLGF